MKRTDCGNCRRWLQRKGEFPPRRKPGSFNRDNAMEAVTKGAGNK